MGWIETDMQLTFNMCDFNLKKSWPLPLSVALLIFPHHFKVVSLVYLWRRTLCKIWSLLSSGTHMMDCLSLLSPNNDVVSAFYAYWVTLLEKRIASLPFIIFLISPRSSSHSTVTILCVSLLSINICFSVFLMTYCLECNCMYCVFRWRIVKTNIQSPWHWCLQSTLE